MNYEWDWKNSRNSVGVGSKLTVEESSNEDQEQGCEVVVQLLLQLWLLLVLMQWKQRKTR